MKIQIHAGKRVVIHHITCRYEHRQLQYSVKNISHYSFFYPFFFRRAVQAERRCIKDRSFFLTRCRWASGSKPPSLLLKERGRSQPIIIPIIWGFEASYSELSYSFFHESFFHVIMVKTTFVAANSLINPIIYAIRMPEVKTVITKIIFRSASNPLNTIDIPLQNL